MPGCAADSSARPGQSDGELPTGDALTSLSVEKGIKDEYSVSARTDVVFVNDVEWFEVLEDIVVEDVRPLRMDEGVELLEARVAFLHWRGKAFQGPDGAPSGNSGSYCTDTWPPKAFKGSYSVEELELRDGDYIIPVYFTRARHAGYWSLEGLVITYRQGERRYQQVTETFALNIFARDTDAEVATLERGRCNPSTPAHQLGQRASSPPARPAWPLPSESPRICSAEHIPCSVAGRVMWPRRSNPHEEGGERLLVGKRSDITIRARRASRGGNRRSARSAWCGMPPKCSEVRWLEGPPAWSWC